MKTCFKCARSLPVEMFYRHPAMSDGRLGKCKDCTKRDVRGNRTSRVRYYRDYDRARRNRPNRVAQRASYHQRYGSQYPERVRANKAVSNAMRSGSLRRMPCEVCGADRTEAHHEDYSKPLEVRWLCKPHHHHADRARKDKEKPA